MRDAKLGRTYETRRTLLLDTATGREPARARTPLFRCDGDGDALIVCEAERTTRGPVGAAAR